MKLKKIINILLISCFALLSSCSGQEESSPKPPTATLTPTLIIATKQSETHLYWMDRVSRAESLWAASKISSYEVIGRVSWAWHEHSFQITVADGKVIDSRCQSDYDNYTNHKWCETEFHANNYTIPSLFKRARELLVDECFYADFDLDTGVPSNLSFDCPQANDEEEEWLTIFFNNMP